MGTFNHAIIPKGVIDGVNQLFFLPTAPNPPLSLQLVKNAIMMTQVDLGTGVDYTLSGVRITYTVAPVVGSTHIAWYQSS